MHAGTSTLNDCFIAVAANVCNVEHALLTSMTYHDMCYVLYRPDRGYHCDNKDCKYSLVIIAKAGWPCMTVCQFPTMIVF